MPPKQGYPIFFKQYYCMLNQIPIVVDVDTLLILWTCDADKTQQRNTETNRHQWQNGCNRYLQTFSTDIKEYIMYTVPRGTSSKIDNILPHKTGLRRYNKIDSLSPVRSPHFKAG